ncbi:DUF1028 domain-containing protein [Frankia sp. Mgl5]|nr:DUF1028 domain-containing protein [Frankia sp. Mgl5]
MSGPRVEAEVSVARREDVCVAANLMEHPGVAERTVAAYDASATQPFPARLVAALAAADQTGGDLRGGQSAALRVVDPATPSGDTRSGRPVSGEVDLRVDDAREPVGKLRRLTKIAEATFTSEDRVRDVIHNFNADGFDSLYSKYAGGRPRKFTHPSAGRSRRSRSPVPPSASCRSRPGA